MKDQDASNVTAEAADQIEVQSMKDAEAGSFTATWLILLCRLAAVTGDERQEIRSGAVQSIFRILDACGDSLSPRLWELCFHGALLEMLQVNSRAHRLARERNPSQAELSALGSTSGVILAGLATTISRNITIIREMAGFEAIWIKLHIRLADLLTMGSTDLDESLFRSFATFLSGVNDESMLTGSSLAVTFDLWVNNVPIRPTAGGNEKAIIAYLDALRELHRLTSSGLSTALVKRIIPNLQKCAIELVPGAYSTDVDNMIEAQIQILTCLGMLDIGLPELTSAFLMTVSDLITLPYKHSIRDGNKRLTYVAMSKASMTLLEKTITRYIEQEAIFASGAVTEGLEALVRCIKLKYTWRQQGKAPYSWAMATSTAFNLFEGVLSASQGYTLDPDIMEKLWSCAVDIVIAIAAADLSSPMDNKQLLEEETFDLAALQPTLQYLTAQKGNASGISSTQTSGWLGCASLSEGTRQKLMASLARTSLMHEPALAIPMSEGSDSASSPRPLSLVPNIRSGRTYNPSFSPRLRMCYFCLDELVGIVSRTLIDDSSEASARSHTLARTAFPYLVLRLAIPMQRYIADQPLRGRMPTPQSQRLELLYVLRKAREMYCTIGVDWEVVDIETTANVGATDRQMRIVGNVNQEKRHLEWLVPLVSRLGRLARHDRDIADACAGVMEAAMMG